MVEILEVEGVVDPEVAVKAAKTENSCFSAFFLAFEEALKPL